jgi:serine/threonine-protein kinase RsbW
MEHDLISETIQLSIPAELSRVADIRHFVRVALEPFCNDEDFLYEAALAVEEAVANIILHGYKEKKGIITISIHTHATFVEILIQDNAPAFDPTKVPPPPIDVPLEDRPLGGLGVHIMRKYCDKLTHRRPSTGLNELRMIKRYPKR